MALTANKLQQVVDLPVWEWLRFSPITTSALSALAAPDTLTDGRYIYYMTTTSMYRYDAVSDSWMQLATNPFATPVTTISMKYSNTGGFRGRVISGSASSITIPGLYGDILKGYNLRIYAGKGIGQERGITEVGYPVIYDRGVATATSNASQIQDTLKRWKVNQWSGYQVTVIFGTGVTQRRKVLYNSSDTLVFFDQNYQQIDPWNNVGFSAIAPYAIPVSTAGAQTIYQIEAHEATMSSAWDIVPDASSRFVVESGGIWALSALAAAPRHQLFYYDIASDVWVGKTSTGDLYPAALGTDFAFEKITSTGGNYVTGSVLTATSRSFACATNPLTTVDRWENYEVRITSGSARGQRRRIVANGTGSYEVNRKWDVMPDSSSIFAVVDDRKTAYIAGNGNTTLFNYNIDADLMCQAPVYDYGLTRNTATTYNGFDGISINAGFRNTNSITAVNPIPTAKGTGYSVGDILTVTTGGTLGRVYVESISSGGLVETISLYQAGLTYTTGIGKATSGGTGTGCTIEITSVGTTGRITTIFNHFFKQGDTITVSGMTEAAWNTTYTILACDSVTTFDIIITASANAANATAQSTTVMVDSTATWDVNEHVGRIVQISTVGQNPTSQLRRITANTATTLTLQSALAVAAVNGTSRYVIHDPQAHGRDEESPVTSRRNYGYATGGSTTTLIDSTKSWIPNKWASYRIRIVAGTGLGNEYVITSNSATTLTYSAQTFTPDTTTKYIIMDTFGTATGGSTTTLIDTAKNWAVNQWAGKRLRMTSGTGVSQELAIVSNTSTTLTFAAASAPSTDTTYTILGAMNRSAGIGLFHLGGTTHDKGKYLLSPRGGGTTQFDKLDINRQIWDSTFTMSPQSETLTTGTMYAYDGGNRVYFQKDATGRIFYLDLSTMRVENAGQIPFGMSTAIIGNRMEIVTTVDGLKYLYIMRHTGTEFWRTLIYF